MEDRTDLRKLIVESSELIKVSGLKNTDELKACAQELLPLGENEGMLLDVRGNTNKFKFSYKCKISDIEGIKNFIKLYTEKNDETLRISKIKSLTCKSSYIHVHYYRCQHNTRNPKTKDTKKLPSEKPFRRLKNTDCPFMLVFKILKNAEDEFPCIIECEWNHNHPTHSLQVLSFKDVPTDAVEKIKILFKNGFTPGLAYREYLKDLRARCDNELAFHHILADRSKAPRRRDFNSLYAEYNR